MKHDYSGKCAKCVEIMELNPSFHVGLWNWFKTLQKAHPEAHISCAGRGKEEQEKAFLARTSRAHFGQSAHNYNCALDIFRLLGYTCNYDLSWFRDIVGGSVINHNSDQNCSFEIEWYGFPGHDFQELPHVEVRNWKYKNLSLVKE